MTIKKCLVIITAAIFPVIAHAVEYTQTNPGDLPQHDLLYTEPSDTKCATAVFADALSSNITNVTDASPETEIKQWIYTTFSKPDVIARVLECPEIATASDYETIKFIPIKYAFPSGREIVVNYETQPKILKQRLQLGHRRRIPDTNPSPEIGNASDGTIWTNTDPAWYGIMVVESGALKEFVGPDKNNTISIKYINDNIDKLYPRGSGCTSKSALALDNDELNQAVKQTVNIQDDTNDYYVAGDVNLQWISYAEIAMDVAITVITMGGGTVIIGATKAARASKALKGLAASMRALRETDSVRDYIRILQKYSRATAELKQINRATDAAAHAKKAEEVKQLADAIRKMEQTDKNVKQYKQATEAFANINKYRRNLRALRPAQRGNIVARTFRAFKAANTGNKTINRGAKIARAGIKSGKTRDWLFQSTLKNIGKLGKLEEAGGMLYGAITFIGDMYDWTETSTGDYTSGIEFKPLLLLSADDLQGQENVVNYGMWLMWAGDSISEGDDDAAYLQAMDFAEKFWQDLVSQQSESNTHYCNIDIYVVRPVIRNPGQEDASLYYLIMNDTPWTTATNSDIEI